MGLNFSSSSRAVSAANPEQARLGMHAPPKPFLSVLSRGLKATVLVVLLKVCDSNYWRGLLPTISGAHDALLTLRPKAF